MEKIKISEFDKAIDLIFKSEANQGIAIVDENAPNGEAAFLNAYIALYERHKFPDFPYCTDSNHWPQYLGIEEKLVAVWDFDYYQLSLVLKVNGDVVLKQHKPV